jgi:hypothetical protein
MRARESERIGDHSAERGALVWALSREQMPLRSREFGVPMI